MEVSRARPAGTRRRPRQLYAEYPAGDEDEEFERLARSVNDLQRRCAGGGRVARGLHAVPVGFAAGEIRVRPDLLEEARFGFAGAGPRFPVTVRFSAAAPRAEPPGTPDFYGMAVRVGGLPGGAVQDLVMTNKPRTSAPDARVFRALIDST